MTYEPAKFVLKKERLEGAPFYYTVNGTPFEYAQGINQSESEFRSQDNLIWEWYNHPEPSIRRSTIRQRVAAQEIDMGNGLFYKELLSRQPYYGSGTHVRSVQPGSPPVVYESHGPWTLGLTTSALKQLICQDMLWLSRDDAQLVAYGFGSSLMNRAIPTKSHLSLMVSLAELRRDGLPKLIGFSLMKPGSIRPKDIPQKIGDEYLNSQFGLTPVIRDLADLLTVVRDSSKILKEYHNLSKKHVRRKRQFPEIRESSVFTGAAETGFNPPNRNLVFPRATTAKPRVNCVYTQKTWFSGSFRFGLPYGDNFLEKVAYWESESNKLLSVRITPEVLWNTTAWSWLLDWFVNIGDVISNISHLGQDGLVLQYGYVMQTSRIDATVSLPGVRPVGRNSDVSERVTLERKLRLQATPYGFGLKLGDFTPKQWAILGALGLSQSPGVLR